MKPILTVGLLLSVNLLANFNFNECTGSGTFEQEIHKYTNYEDNALVGTIPAGIEGLEISLKSDKDVDIRLYGENDDKIVHWPYGIHHQSKQKTKPYKEVPITYSGYDGVNGEKGHEFIKVEGTTPTAMTMKAFGYKAGYATVNYSWTGKVGCEAVTSGNGSFTQAILNKASNLVGTIPPGVENVHINLTSNKDLDIQLFAQDGTAIASWKPAGLMAGANEQSLEYAEMDITWSGYNGVDGKKGHEYITISNTTSQMLVMKVYGYEAGTADVTYSWGDASLPSTIQTEKTTYFPNEIVAVNVQGYLSGDKDWVGIYPKGSNNDWNNVIKWNFVEHTGLVNITDTQYTSNDEMIAGDYEVRLFFHNSYDLEAKYAFHVSADGGNKVYPKESILKHSAINTLYGDTMINKPAKGQSVVDNVLGTKITQINKVEVEGRNTYSPYPKRQAWNKDMTLIRVGNRLYDAHTYQESPITHHPLDSDLNNDEAWTQLCSRASDSFVWSNIESDTFYVLTHGNDFIKAKINGNDTDCTNALDTFDEYEYIYLGIGEGNFDENDKYVVFLGKKKDDLKIYVILYDIQEKKRVWNVPKVLKLEDDKWIKSNNQWIPLHIDWISISPSGKHIVVNNAHGYADGDSKGGIFVYDRETFANKVQLKYKEYDKEGIKFAKGEHGDIGYDQEGNEVWVQFVTHYGVYMFNLDKPNELGQEVLMSSATGGHISCRNIKRHGWCYVSNYNYDHAYAFAVKLEADTDGSNGIAKEKVELFSRTFVREWVEDPMDYPFAGVSPDGTKMIFNSYWGDNILGTFIAEVADASTILTYGEPQTNIANKGTYTQYKIYAHAGDVLNVDLYDMDANANLYVKAGSQASVESYDCKSENGGETHSTENDSCSITIENDGYVYVAVHAPTYGCNNNVKHTINIMKENNNYVYGSEGPYINEVEFDDTHTEYFAYYPKNHVDDAPLVLVSGYSSVYKYDGLMKYLASHGCYVVGHATRLDNQGWNDIAWRIEDFEPAVVAAQNLGVDTSRLITMGSSTGGMVAYALMKHFKEKGYATENSIIIDIQGWYAQNMTKSQLANLNSHSLIIALGGNNGVQQYSDGSDASQDPRVLLTLSKLMSKDKSFHVIDDIHHSYAGGEYADILTKNNLLAPIDAMIKYEFFNENGQYNDAESILFDQYEQTIHDVYTATMDYVGNDGDWKNGYYYPCVDKQTGGLIYPSIDYCNDHGLQ